MTLGEIAYETYRHLDGGRADNGSVRRSWQGLSVIQRQAWETAANAVARQAVFDARKELLEAKPAEPNDDPWSLPADWMPP